MLTLSTLFFQETTAAEPSAGGQLLGFVPIMLVVFGIMYFLVIRPEKKRQKARVEMLGQMKKGDRVLTTGGMLGKVVNIKDEEITLEVDQNVRIRFARSAIAQILRNEETAKEAELAGK